MPHEKRAHRYAIVSGKGGVGKSMIAANLAAAMVASGRRVLVLDADLGLANLDVLLGLNAAHTLLDALRGQKRVEDVVISTAGGFDLLPAGSGVLEATWLNESISERLEGILSKIESNYDFILFDAGAGIGDVVLFFTQISDDVILVVTPEPTSVMDGYATIKVLAGRYRRRDLLLVVNQADADSPDRTGAAVAHHLQNVASRFLPMDGVDALRLQLAASVPQDSAVVQSVSRQQLLFSHQPNAPAARALQSLARFLMERSPAQ